MFSHLECPFCSEVRTTARGMYWHLRTEHHYAHIDAYCYTADALAHCQHTHGADKDLAKNDKDWMSNKENWRSKYDKKDSGYFDRRGR